MNTTQTTESKTTERAQFLSKALLVVKSQRGEIISEIASLSKERDELAKNLKANHGLARTLEGCLTIKQVALVSAEEELRKHQDIIDRQLRQEMAQAYNQPIPEVDN